MKLITFFIFLLQIVAVISSRQVSQRQNPNYSPIEIDNAWIRVPWSSGGYYFHNTLTREDRDDHPPCLSGMCHWNWAKLSNEL